MYYSKSIINPTSLNRWESSYNEYLDKNLIEELKNKSPNIESIFSNVGVIRPNDIDKLDETGLRGLANELGIDVREYSTKPTYQEAQAGKKPELIRDELAAGIINFLSEQKTYDDYDIIGHDLPDVEESLEVSTVGPTEVEQEQYHKVGGYPAIKAAISDYPEITGVNIVNIIRRLRNGELNFDIEENDMSWSSGDITMYSMDTTTLIIYREELAINDKWKDKIEDFLDKHMFPKCVPFNNEYGFIWLASDDSEIYGRLILKQERGMNDHFWNRAGVDDFYF